jgi:hypothetical protein
VQLESKVLLNTSPLPDVLTIFVTAPVADPDGGALIGEVSLGALTVGVEPPGGDANECEPSYDGSDAALTDGEEGSAEANAGDGAKPPPHPKCDRKLVSARKRDGLQPSVSHDVSTWFR